MKALQRARTRSRRRAASNRASQWRQDQRSPRGMLSPYPFNPPARGSAAIPCPRSQGGVSHNCHPSSRSTLLPILPVAPEVSLSSHPHAHRAAGVASDMIGRALQQHVEPWRSGSVPAEDVRERGGLRRNGTRVVGTEKRALALIANQPYRRPAAQSPLIRVGAGSRWRQIANLG
jgi:hypothetical protein